MAPLFELWLRALAFLLLGSHQLKCVDNRTEVAILNICNTGAPWLLTRSLYRAFEPVVNNLTDMFPTYRLKIYYQCAVLDDTGGATKAFIEGYFKEPEKALILGVAYSTQSQAVSAVARFYYVPVLASSNTSPLLSNKILYTTYSRLQLTPTLFNSAIIQVLNRYQWRRIGILLTESDQIYPVGVQFESLLLNSNITVAYKALYSDSARDSLARMKSDDIRIFVVFNIGYSDLVPIPCLIYEMGLYGPKYQWIFNGLPDLPASKPVNACTVDMQARATENAVIFNAAFKSHDYKPMPSPTGLTISDLVSAFGSAYPTLVAANATLARAFDTLMTAALAINDTLKTSAYSASLDQGNNSFKSELLKNIRRQDFQGIEGPVKFDSNGDRIGQVIIYQIRNNIIVPTAIYDPTASTVWNQDLTFQGNKPPVDQSVVLEEIVQIPTFVVVVYRVLSAIGLAMVLASVYVNVRFRHLKLIKLSSPNVNLLIALGCALGYCSCILMSLDLIGRARVTQCWSAIFSLTLGYSCAFGGMFAKTWRVHVIFTNKKLRRVAIRDWHLIAVVAVLILVDLVVLIAWVLVDPIKLKKSIVDTSSPDEDVDSGIEYKYETTTCETSLGPVWNGTLIGIKGLVLLFGIFFAWETRKVYVEALNDSKQIGICVYNTMIMGAIGVSLSFVLPSTAVALQFALVSACILICSTTTLILVFGSKILLLIQHGQNRVDDVFGTDGGTEMGRTNGGTVIGGFERKPAAAASGVIAGSSCSDS